MNIENLSTLKIHKLTQSQYDRELKAGNIDENALYLTPDENKEIFCAEYNVTTYTEIKTAIDAGKLCFCRINDMIVPLYDVSSERIRFVLMATDLTVRYYALSSEDAWTTGGTAISEQINTAVSNIDYPVDAVNGKTGDVVLSAPDVGAIPECISVNTIDTDLNDYITEGWYSFSAAFVPINIPTGTNGWLHVVRRKSLIDETRTVVKQFWYRLGDDTTDHECYMRSYDNEDSNDTSTGWTTWKKFITDKDININNIVYASEENSEAAITPLNADTLEGQTVTSLTASLTSTILNAIYPIGSVYVSNTNTTPANQFGGEWELIGKGFTEANEHSITDTLFENTHSVSSYEMAYARSGSSISLKIKYINATELSDTTVILGKLNLSALGITEFPWAILYSISGSDDGNAVTMNYIYADGTIEVRDIVGGSSVATGSTGYVLFTFTCNAEHMIDSFCDKFYWKRTA